MSKYSLLLAAAAGALAANPVAAQSQRVDSITVFGDSYAQGANNGFQNVTDPALYPSPGADPETLTTLRFVPYPYFVQQLLDIPNERSVNYAIGGSTTDVFNAVPNVPLSLPFQLAAWNGRSFGSNELVVLSIGANDANAINGVVAGFGGPSGTAFTNQAATVLAGQAVPRALAGVNRLVNAGARNLSVGTFSQLTVLPGVAFTPNPAASDLYGRLFAEQYIDGLRPYAAQGVRIFVLDGTAVIGRVEKDLSAYGFDSLLPGQGQRSLFADPIHLSSAGMRVLAAFTVNQINAPDAVSSQADFVQATSIAMTRGLLNQSGRGNAGSGLFFDAGYNDTRRDDRFGAIGYGGNAWWVQGGYERRFASGDRIGVAIAYTESDGNLLDARGGLTSHAIQGSLYGEANVGGLTADTALAVAGGRLKGDRPGVISPLEFSTDSFSVVADARIARFFDLGGFRVGPLATLTAAHTKLDPYQETGDPILQFRVVQDSLTTVVGGLGIEARTKPAAPIEATLAITAETAFDDGARMVTSYSSQAPTLPIFSPIDGTGRDVSGRVRGGFNYRTGTIDLGVGGDATFARPGGDDYSISAHVALAF